MLRLDKVRSNKVVEVNQVVMPNLVIRVNQVVKLNLVNRVYFVVGGHSDPDKNDKIWQP